MGGFFAGLLGIGGGIVFIPVLTYFFKKLGITDPDLTKAFLANSFFAIIFSGISGSIKQFKVGHFYPKQVIYTSVGAIITSLLVSKLIAMGSWYDNTRFTFFFIAVLVFLNIRLYIHRKNETSLDVRGIPSWKFILTGIFTGGFAALSGLGGGFIMVMLFVQWLQADIKQSTAISTGTIPFITLPLTIYYMVQQPVNYPPEVTHIGFIIIYAIIPLIIGVLVATPSGVTLSRKLNPATIKTLFILLSAVIITKMAYNIIWH
jgi:uncharacterized membrane protein YfcA